VEFGKYPDTWYGFINKTGNLLIPANFKWGKPIFWRNCQCSNRKQLDVYKD
jgi:hypothetical protein